MLLEHRSGRNMATQANIRKELRALESIDGPVIIIVDDSNRVLYSNQAASSLYGIPTEDAVGEPLENLVEVEESPINWVEIRRTVAEEGQWRANVGHMARDGRRSWYDWTIERFNAPAENVPWMIAVATDVTGRKRAEEERLVVERLVEHSHKLEAFGVQVAALCCDFTNVLTALRLSVSFVRESVPEVCEQRDALDDIIEIGRHIEGLVSRLPVFERKAAEVRSLIQLQDVLDDALKRLSPVLPRTIEVRRHCDPEVGPIVASLAQMHQVIVNLVTQAVHSLRNRNGVLELRLEAIEAASAFEGITWLPAGRYARLSVRDTGRGLSPKTLMYIFDACFRADDVSTDSDMRLVHDILRAHNGAISVENEVGVGSQFVILLPLANQQDHVAAAWRGFGICHLGTERILFIEDDKPTVELMKPGLEQLGYVVETYPSHVEALAAFEDHPDRFDVVITDEIMPRMTGIEVLRTVLQIRPQCPVIVCAERWPFLREEAAKQEGFCGYIKKPVVPQQLANAIRRVVPQRRNSQEG